MSDKIIYETINSVIISADRAAAVQENRNRWAERSIIRQQDHISYHSREVNIVDVDLILQATRESAVTHKYVETRIFMSRNFSHHVN